MVWARIFFKIITVTLQTELGGAIFERSVRHRHNDTSNELAGSISRLNAYGKPQKPKKPKKSSVYDQP